MFLIAEFPSKCLSSFLYWTLIHFHVTDLELEMPESVNSCDTQLGDQPAKLHADGAGSATRTQHIHFLFLKKMLEKLGQALLLYYMDYFLLMLLYLGSKYFFLYFQFCVISK